MKHQLSLELPPTTNVHILRIDDSSIYAGAIPVECSRLEITVPGYIHPSVIETEKEFRLSLDSCLLQLHLQGCPEEHRPLPDGIYVLRYSVSPNNKVFIEYNHLRMVETMNLYGKKLSKLKPGDCEPSAELKKDLREFQLIRSFLEAAKAKVEHTHEPQKGMELFLYARKQLEQQQNCTAC